MSCRPFLRILRWFDLRFMLGDVIHRQLQHLFCDDEIGEAKVRGEFPFSSVTIGTLQRHVSHLPGRTVAADFVDEDTGTDRADAKHLFRGLVRTPVCGLVFSCCWVVSAVPTDRGRPA